MSGPLRFQLGFFEYFNMSGEQVAAKRYPNNTILYQRDQQYAICVEANIRDFNENILLYNKYPNYAADIKLLSDKKHYAIYYVNHLLYDENLTLPVTNGIPKVKPYSELKPLDKDYRIPF